MIAIHTGERNGGLVGAVLVQPTDEAMLISTGGVLIRISVSKISELGRATQGVKLIALGEGDKLAGIQRVAESDEDDAPDEAEAPPDASTPPTAAGDSPR